MKFERSGHINGTYIANQPDTLASFPVDQLDLTFDGVPGDRHYGLFKPADSRVSYLARGTRVRNARQLSIVSVEELRLAAQNLGIPKLLPEWLGANLLVSSIPELSFLPPSTRMVFPSNAVLVVEGENNPCKSAGKVVQAQNPDVPGLDTTFPTGALHLRGITAWVEHPGVIRPGDSVRLIIPELRPYSVDTVQEKNASSPV